MTRGDDEVEENSCVDELRRRMKGEMCEKMFEDDTLFKRFLRARNHNLDAAENMLRNHLHWRKLNRVDSILTEFTPHQIMVNYSAVSRLGRDPEGSPVTYCEFGSIDTKGLVKSLKVPDVSNYFIYHLEGDVASMMKQNKKLGKKVNEWVYIVNFENFSIANATDRKTIEVVIKLIRLYDANYPERLKAAYLINASFVFTSIWAAVKPFFSGATIQKIKIFGKDGWQQELRRDIGANILPEFLGGNLTDPDGNPRCNTFINHGGLIPEKYFKNKTECVSDLPGSKKLIVNRMSKAEINIEVMYPGSLIHWSFDVTHKDIAYALFFRDHMQDNSEVHQQLLIPKQRVETSIQTESGFFKCDKTGIYILQFDNSYSWIHSKEIHYVASVGNAERVFTE